MLTTEAKREIAACAIGIAGAVLFILVIPAMLAPTPGPAAPRMAPIITRPGELPTEHPTETWAERVERLKREGKKAVR